MDDRAVTLLRCPVCDIGMTRSGRSLACGSGHAFDVAAAGYLNLLGGHRSRPSGDNRDMLLARRRFLGHGHYEPLSKAVTRLAQEGLDRGAGLPAAAGLCAVEVGSGTGYHLARLAGGTVAGAAPPSWFGIDASKEAARIAAVDHKGEGLCFLVADVWRRVPLAPASALALLSVFAPRNAAEFARLLHPAGVVVVALPADDHLAELAGTLGLLRVHPGKEQTLADDMQAFEVVQRQPLRFPMHLTPADVEDLVRMGPSARHLDPHEIATRAGSAPRTVTASFVTLAFRLRCA
jgi:23S rRNA (guanine745-N1)-methyltransferase